LAEQKKVKRRLRAGRRRTPKKGRVWRGEGKGVGRVPPVRTLKNLKGGREGPYRGRGERAGGQKINGGMA